MPLRALLDGRDVVAALLTDDAWADLSLVVSRERSRVVLPCCGTPAYLRTSAAGLRHFVHRRRAGVQDCAWARESPEHLLVKACVVRTLSSLGYDVATEVYGGSDWRADVLASKAGTRVVVEAQLSLQSIEETERRSARYRRDGVKCVWLFARPPRHVPREDLPVFGVRDDVTSQVAWAGLLLPPPRPSAGSSPPAVWRTPWTLDAFLRALFAGQVRFCSRLRARRRQELKTTVRAIVCPRCRSRSEVHVHTGDMWSPCGATLARESWRPYDVAGGFEPGPEQFSGARALPDWQGLTPFYRFTSPRRRWASRPSNGSGIIIRPFSCPGCRRPFTADVLRSTFWRQPVVSSVTRVVDLKTPLYEPQPHWCYVPAGAGHRCE